MPDLTVVVKRPYSNCTDALVLKSFNTYLQCSKEVTKANQKIGSERTRVTLISMSGRLLVGFSSLSVYKAFQSAFSQYINVNHSALHLNSHTYDPLLGTSKIGFIKQKLICQRRWDFLVAVLQVLIVLPAITTAAPWKGRPAVASSSRSSRWPRAG